MNKLLQVSFSRLSRDKLFYLCMAIVLVLALITVTSNAPSMAESADDEEGYALEDCYYNLAPVLGFVFAAFTCNYLGVEYSDGTLRNKLIAGHSRNSVFLSFFLTSAFGCFCITIVCLIGSLPGLYWFPGFGFGWKIYALSVAVLLCSALVFAAVFSTISMLISNRAISMVVSFTLWFALLFIGSSILNMLSAKEIIQDGVFIDGQGIMLGEPHPNPAYIGGAKRKMFEALTHIIPVCPAIKMAGYSPEGFFADILCSLGMTVAVLSAGCALFHRKDLK